MKKTNLIAGALLCGASLFMASCQPKQAAPQLTKSGLDPENFVLEVGGKQTALYTLTNANGLEVCITNYGGRVVSLVVPDRDGKPTDVVLGFDNIFQYADTLNSPTDYGSSVGRYANRIAGGKFTLNGEEYQLKQNDGPNCLHGGGTTGWMNQVYSAEQIGDSILKLTIVAPDGENGFPGTVTATTTYTLTADNTLDMVWEATTDKETIINQTNHNYYNLNGDFNNVILVRVLNLCILVDLSKVNQVHCLKMPFIRHLYDIFCRRILCGIARVSSVSKISINNIMLRT